MYSMEKPSFYLSEQKEHLIQPESREALTQEVLIRHAVENNLELLPETERDAVERRAHAGLIRLLEFVSAHPAEALHWPVSAREIPAWIHAFFQSQPLSETTSSVSVEALFKQSEIFSSDISFSELSGCVEVKNGLRIYLQEFFSEDENDLESLTNAEQQRFSKRIRINELVTLIGAAITEQAQALSALDRAQETMKHEAPDKLPKLPVMIQANPQGIPGANYLGRTDSHHLIEVNFPKRARLSQLVSDEPNRSVELSVSIVEHELLHATQAEKVAKNNPDSMSPFLWLRGTTEQLLHNLPKSRKEPADTIALSDQLLEEAMLNLKPYEDSLRLVTALLEGQVIIHQLQLLNRRIADAVNPKRRGILEETKQLVLGTLREALTGEQLQEKKALSAPQLQLLHQQQEVRRLERLRYLEGKRLYSKLYKEFGVDALPELFAALDFERILTIPVTEAYLKRLIEDPRMIPGLEEVPMVQKSLEARPPKW